MPTVHWSVGYDMLDFNTCLHKYIFFSFSLSILFVQSWFSPGQIFVLDEYCARYGVRSCYRHLCYLNDMLNLAEKGIAIDPSLIHYSFAFCSSHVHGDR